MKALATRTLHPSRFLALLLLALVAVAPSALAGDWRLKDSSGAKHALSELKGKWVLVNFWAPWCPPCLKEMPEFSALQKQHADLQVIGVAIMYRSSREVMNVARGQSVPYPIVMGTEDIASEFGEIRGLPTSFLYSPDGNLVGRHDGPLTQADIERVLQQKEPDGAGIFTR